MSHAAQEMWEKEEEEEDDKEEGPQMSAGDSFPVVRAVGTCPTETSPPSGVRVLRTNINERGGGGGEEGCRPARQPLLPSDEERSAFRTHYLCHLVRLVFLFSHGILVLTVASALDRWGEASWYFLFAPAWIGDLLCCGLLVFSWFASCPYIKLCHREGKVRVGSYPSFLTEVLPEIVLSFVGLFGLLFIVIGEYFFCTFMASSQQGDPHGLVAATVFLIMVSCISICNGALFTHNSPMYLAVGLALFSTMVIFVMLRDAAPQEKAWILVPTFMAVIVILLAALLRLFLHRHLLACEEKVLRLAEAAFLAVLLVATGSALLKTAGAEAQEGRGEGMLAGIVLSLMAVLRSRLCWWEALEGTLEERAIREVSVPAEGSFDSEDSVEMARH